MEKNTENDISTTPFALGEYRIDPGVNQIAGQGSPVQVEPKAMAVLCVLASRAGETIGREELLAAVWPGRVVVEETLTRAIGQLRAALSDNASKPRYIQTVPKQGYRLIAAVERPATDVAKSRSARDDAPAPADPAVPATRPARRNVLVGTVAFALFGVLLMVLIGDKPTQELAAPASKPVAEGVTVAPAQPSVAVLPFRNLSPDSASEYFAEGIAEELLNALAGVQGLRVPSRRSSFAFKGKATSLGKIAAQLNVRHVLEGSVRRSGETLRVSAQLIHVGTDTTVWSQQYDRKLQSIFTVQEEIAQQVITALRGRLLEPAHTDARIARSASLDAYSLYLQGQYWWMNGTTSNWFHLARDAFEQAIKLDPDFADAHAGLAYIYARYNFYDEYMPAAEAWPKAEQALGRALELDPTAVDALFARAILATSTGEYASARADLDRALALSPNDSTAHFLYSEVWLAENRPQQAIAAAGRALDLDPLSPWVNVNMGIVMFSAGRWDEAKAMVDRAVEIDPDYTWAYVWRARIEQARGNLALAIVAMHHCVAIDPASVSNSAYLGLLYLELRDVERAQAWFEHSASLQGDNSAARLWQRFYALVVEQGNPQIFIELSQDMSRLETPIYSLVPYLLPSQIEAGASAESIALLARHHPELIRDPPLVVNMASARTAVALVQLLRELGDGARAERLLAASLETAALFPSQFAWMGLDAEVLALAGRQDEALAALQRSFESGWLANWWMLERSPALVTVRASPGFRELVQSVQNRSADQLSRVLEMEAGGQLVTVPISVTGQ